MELSCIQTVNFVVIIGQDCLPAPSAETMAQEGHGDYCNSVPSHLISFTRPPTLIMMKSYAHHCSISAQS